MAHQRIAVVDLGSCGTTGLRWLDLIPLLRRCYSHIVGIDFSAPEFCGSLPPPPLSPSPPPPPSPSPLDPEFKLPHGLTGPQQGTLYACDYWLLASDKSISRQVDLPSKPALLVQEVLKRDPLSGHLFCFRGRRGDLLKVIWHDGQGACLFTKRLERGRFLWPSVADGVVTISPAQLGYLLSGIDWRHPQESWRPTSMG